MRKRLYKVEQGVWGANYTTTLYFEEKAEADKYVQEHDYCNHDGYVCPNEKIKEHLLDETSYFLNYAMGEAAV